MTVTWISRADAGLRAPDVAHLTERHAGTRPLVGATVHHTATPGIDTPAEAEAAWRAIQLAALDGRLESGDVYGDIPYAAGFDDWGRIYVGRAQGHYVGAHARSNLNVANETTFGVAYIGENEPTDAALEALQAYLYVVSITIHASAAAPLRIMSHREWEPFGGTATDCPGDHLQGAVTMLRIALG